MTDAVRTKGAWDFTVARALVHRDQANAEFLVEIAEATEEAPQRDVAAALGASQTQVHRWAAKGRELMLLRGSELFAWSAYDLIQRYARDEIRRDQLVTILAENLVKAAASEAMPGARTTPEWDVGMALGVAATEGLIDDRIAPEIAAMANGS